MLCPFYQISAVNFWNAMRINFFFIFLMNQLGAHLPRFQLVLSSWYVSCPDRRQERRGQLTTRRDNSSMVEPKIDFAISAKS